MALRAYHLGTGQPVEVGEALTDFRGEEHRFMRAVDATTAGRSGKVEVATWAGSAGRRWFYASVFDLVVKEE